MRARKLCRLQDCLETPLAQIIGSEHDAECNEHQIVVSTAREFSPLCMIQGIEKNIKHFAISHRTVK